MRDYREAMVENLERRTFLSHGLHVHAAAMPMVFEAARVAVQTRTALLVVSTITIEAPAAKALPVPGLRALPIIKNSFGRAIKAHFGGPRMLPPAPRPEVPAYEPPTADDPAPAPQPPPMNRDEPIPPPVASSHEESQPQPNDAVANVETTAEQTSMPEIAADEAQLAEVVDASGEHKVVATIEPAPAEASSAFAALFTRTLTTGGEIVSETAKLAAAAPSIVANAVPAVAKTAQSFVSPQRYFHIERLSNPLALIGDAAAAFAEESALLGSTVATARYAKAWAITASVIAFDAAVLMYWMQVRRRRHAVAHNLWAAP